DWALDGGIPKLVERVKDPATRQRLIAEMQRSPYNWNLAVVAMVQQQQNKQFEGKSIAQVAQSRNKSPEETTLDLLAEENGTVRMVYFSMSEDDVRYAMRVPWISVGSDGTAFKPEACSVKANHIRVLMGRLRAFSANTSVMTKSSRSRRRCGR